MTQAALRPTVRGPTFIRLLARLAERDVAPSGLSLPERLGQWLDWKHALSLAAALDGKPAAPDGDAAAADELHAECTRVREVLATAVREAPLLATGVAGAGADFAPFRELCLARQRAMQTATGRLRGRLRDALAQGGGVARDPGTPARMAQLAEVDAVMEAALTPREHALLANVPDLLGRRFERLRAAATGTRWLDGFRREMQAVLLAELDLRFQPVDALLAALRTP